MKNKIKDKINTFKLTHTDEQILSLTIIVLLVISTITMAIIRLCGVLWCKVDYTKYEYVPQIWQQVIKSLLLVFEMSFCYKMTTRTNWFISILLAGIHTVLASLIPYPYNNIASNIFWLIISLLIIRRWIVILDVLFIFIVASVYGLVFLTGRVGGITEEAIKGFYYTVIGAIDYKLFIVSLYLIVNYVGGIKVCKKLILVNKNLTRRNRFGTLPTAPSSGSETTNQQEQTY